MAMSAKERKQLMGLLIFVPLAAIVGFWIYVHKPQAQETSDLERHADSLQVQVDSDKKDLKAGTVEALQQRIATYEGSLQLMRRLVPTDAEVANLLDDISNRAKLRNITINAISPMGTEPDGQFQVAKYKLEVVGHYDDIGGFLSDIAALPRIMVPVQLALKAVPLQQAKSFGDTTGALLLAQFQLRTFVKSKAADTTNAEEAP